MALRCPFVGVGLLAAMQGKASGDAEMPADEIHSLYRRSLLGHSSSLILGAILVFALAPHVGSSAVALWYGALAAVAVLCTVSAHLSRRARPFRSHHPFSERNLSIAGGLCGAVWGSAGLLFFPEESVAHQVFLALMLVGITAVGTAVHTTRLSASVIFAGLVAGPLVARLFLGEGEGHFLVALATMVLVGAIIATARNATSGVRADLAPPTETQALERERRHREQADTALRLNEERFRDYAETAADFFWETAADLQFAQVSGPYQELIGASLLDIAVDAECGECPYDLGEQWEMGERLHNLQARRPFGRFAFKWHGANASPLVLQISGRPVFEPNGRFAGYRGAGRDVSAGYRVAVRLVHQATHDPLTGLVNRREFERRLARVLASVREHGAACALCFLDLDHFKHVNDSAGHRVGDELLRQVTALILGKLGARDTLARLGGDEFALLLQRCPTDKAVELTQSIVEEIKHCRFFPAGQRAHVGLSVGIASVTQSASSPDALLHQADAACYTAKRLGGSQVKVHAGDSLGELPCALRTRHRTRGSQPIAGFFPASLRPASTLEVLQPQFSFAAETVLADVVQGQEPTAAQALALNQ